MSTYEITAYPLAELPVPGWECFFGQNDPDFHRLIFYTWVIKGNGKTILVDAGPPPDEEDFVKLRKGCQRVDIRSELKWLTSLEAAFQKANITPEEIDFLLITQLITYHSGGLLQQYFPKANVYLPKAGMLEFLFESPGHPPRDLYFTEATWSFLWQLLVHNRLLIVDDLVEVLPGLFFETTGGHHPGSAAVTVNSAGGRVSILETAFLKRNIDDEIPIGVAEDTSACRKAIRRYKTQSDLVLAIHDNTILDRFPGGLIEVGPHLVRGDSTR